MPYSLWTKQAEKSISLQSYSLPVAREAENIGDYELAPVHEQLLGVPVSESS